MQFGADHVDRHQQESPTIPGLTESSEAIQEDLARRLQPSRRSLN
jgi:hypothetical protein